MKRIAAASCAILVAGFGAAPNARAGVNDSVAVNAGADQDYVRQKFGRAGAEATEETYAFAQGNSFGGLIRDPSLEHAQFMDIARALAPNLAVQRYFPAKDGKHADILIVVHWGLTYIDRSLMPAEDLMKDAVGHTSASGEHGIPSGGIEEPGFMREDIDAMNSHAASGAGGAGPSDNAQLLGYDSELQRAQYRALGLPWGDSKTIGQISEETFGEDIFGLNPLSDARERYFVILEAYDFASIKEGRKGVKPRLLWSIHYSIGAIGHNFMTALPAMSKVAASYFGRNSGGLVLHAERVSNGSVEVGEPKSVDEGKQK